MRKGFEAAGVSQSLTLVVDPDSTAAVQLATQLARAGFPSNVAFTCADAIDAIKEQHYGSVVVVAALWNARCVDCLHLIRRRAPRSWLVIVCADDDASTVRVFHRCGGDALVKLPFTVEGLVDRLAALSRVERPV